MIDSLPIILALINIGFTFPYGFLKASRVLIYLALKKNPKWVMDHPEFKTHKILDQVLTYTLYALSAGNLAALIYFGLIEPRPDLYFAVAIVPMEIAGTVFIAFLLILHFGIARKIPAPETVKASLSDRSLDMYINPLVFVPGIIGFVALGFYYVYAFMIGDIAQDIFAVRIAEIIAGPALMYAILQYFLKRKYSECEEIFGLGSRKYEVWMLVFIFYFSLLIRFDRFSYDFLGGMLIKDAVAIPIICFIAVSFTCHYVRQPRVKKLLEEYRDLLDHNHKATVI